MKIKAEYIDTYVSDPLTSKIIWCRNIPTELYDYYFNNGHSELFEPEDEPVVESKKIKKDDIS